MESPKINFIEHLQNKHEKKGKKILPKLLFYPLIFVIIFFVVFSFQVVFSGQSIIENIEKINIFQNYGLTLTKDKPLAGENEDRINFLITGMGGEGHPGPYLTDTIILASYKPSTKKVVMISIPRDLSIHIPDYGWRKINFVNHLGEMNEAGNGAKYAAEIIGKTLEIPIHYYVRLDFAGFKELIDELDGVKVYVENGFSDSQFPTDDLGYQTVSFATGWQKMDGETALNFARSRHGNNNESSDFARSKRQQKIIQAVKDKALSFTTFLSYRKIAALLNMYENHVKTNLKSWEILRLVKIFKEIKQENISSITLDNSPDGLLFSTNINGAYLLLPKDMSFYQLQQTFKYAFDEEKQKQAKEPVKIEIQNGTKVEGLAYKTSVDLKKNGYKIIKIGNALKQDYEKTVIYDLSNGQKPQAIEDIKSKLQANISVDKPEWLTDISNVDILIILGLDQQTISRR